VSDHRIIRFKMTADPRVPKQYRNPLSTDWSRFKTELIYSLGGWEGHILTTNDIESNVNLHLIHVRPKLRKILQFPLNRSFGMSFESICQTRSFGP
jgi:hypothetical protein